MAWIPHRSGEPLRAGGDPFSHPSGSSASVRPMFRSPTFEPKGAGRDYARSRLPPARFSRSPVFYHWHCLCSKPPWHWPRAQSRFSPGSRKPSVPGRVHSVPESCGSQAAFALPGSNPLLTHGTVESPAKLFLPLLKNREPPRPISPMAPVSNTCPGWRRLSKISLCSSLDV